MLWADLSSAGSSVYGAVRDAYSGGLSSTPLVVTVLGGISVFLKLYGPQILATVLALLQHNPPVNPPNPPVDPPTPPTTDLTGLIRSLLDSLNLKSPILRLLIDALLAIPPEKIQEILVGLKEQINATNATK